MLGRLYNIVINVSSPGSEQLFALFLLLEYTSYKGYKLFIGLLDYEKAFDFVNRFRLIDKLVKIIISFNSFTSLL